MTAKQLKEFSKRVIVAVMVLWFIGAIFGAVMICVETYIAIATIEYVGVAYDTHLPDLLTYIGAPVTGGLIMYMAKSAFENKSKIERGNKNAGYYSSVDDSNVAP